MQRHEHVHLAAFEGKFQDEIENIFEDMGIFFFIYTV